MTVLSTDTTTCSARAAAVRDGVVFPEISGATLCGSSRRRVSRWPVWTCLQSPPAPNHFTGLRVGIVQGQVTAIRRPIVPVSTLEALAAIGGTHPGVFVALTAAGSAAGAVAPDARMPVYARRADAELARDRRQREP